MRIKQQYNFWQLFRSICVLCHRPAPLLTLGLSGGGAAPAAEDLGHEDAAHTG